MQELRKQLESHVTTIESLRSENRAATERHETVCSPHAFDLSCMYLLVHSRTKVLDLHFLILKLAFTFILYHFLVIRKLSILQRPEVGAQPMNQRVL